jgi:DNA-binding GntR family transcriptional regulator
MSVDIAGQDGIGPASRPESRVSRVTLAGQVEEAIRSDIIGGILEPGRRLRAAELTSRYGVSATPLREALQRLAAQKLVELGPRLGATVAPISITELEDIYFLRELLESLALERSIRLAGDAWAANVRRAFSAFESIGGTGPAATREDAIEWAALHRAFHEALFQACDSAWLLRFVATLSDHSERYRMLSMRRGLRHSLQEHREIYDAALARDAAAATDALRRHLSGTVALLENAIPGLSRSDRA